MRRGFSGIMVVGRHSPAARALARLGLLLVWAMTMTVFANGGESSIRCGTHLLSLGASRATVRAACGEPSTARLLKTDIPGPKGTRLHVEGELWTYDFGASEFTYALTFAGDSLRSIERGDYGR